jgi:hypothetical protein
MGLYTDLSVKQRSILQSFTNFTREWCGSQARANNRASVILDDYSAQVSGIIELLNSGVSIPDTSSLDGTAALTKEEVLDLVGHMGDILTDMSPHASGFDTSDLREIWTKAVGARNMIGGG